MKPIYESTNYGVANSTKNQKQAYSHATQAYYSQGYNNGGSNMTNHLYTNLKDDGQKFDYDDATGEHIYDTITLTDINGCKNDQESNIYDSVYEPTDKSKEDSASSNTSNIVNNRVCETICEQEEDDEALDTDNIYESIDENSTNNKEATKPIDVMKGLDPYLKIIGDNALNMQHLDLITKVDQLKEKAKEIEKVINEITELRTV